MTHWHISHKGSVEGPLSETEVLERLKSGQLTYLDFAFSAEVGWKLISEIEAFNRVQVDRASHSWIVLREGKEASQTDGPFRREVIEAFLASGELRYSDFIWSEGPQGWRRIGEMKEFESPMTPSLSVPYIDPTFSTLASLPSAPELLQNVMVMNRDPQNPDVAPPETDGVDLTQGRDGSWVMLSKLVLILFTSSLFTQAFAQGTSETKSSPQNSTQISKILDIVPLKLSSSRPQLAFESDVSVGGTIKVRVRARTGEVLRVLSYDREFEVVRQSGEVPTLDLSELSMPAGSYQVLAQLGETKVEKEIFLGQRDANFEKELEVHLKQISERQQAEKKALFYAAKNFEMLSTRLLKEAQKTTQKSNRNWNQKTQKWASFYKAWRKDFEKAEEPIKELLPSRKEPQVAFPEELEAFVSASRSLSEQASMLDQAMRQRRSIASENPVPAAVEFSKLRERAGQLRTR